MRRVVVTGLGIVSSLGNNQQEVRDSLYAGRSGIRLSEEYRDIGFRSHVFGPLNMDPDELIDRKIRRFMGDGAAYNYIAMQEAIADAGLEEVEVSNPRTGLVMGSGGPSTSNMLVAWDTFRAKGIKKVGPYMVPRSMSNTNSACLATPFKIKGVNYSISSACATSAHCIGNGMELIQLGKQDIVFAGGGEELHWTLSVLFDAMGALSSKYNDTPETASRPYDETRDGFVISGGGGVLVLEELEHANARGAKIYGELTGYGATSDGYDMVQPSGEGAVRCMRQAMAMVDAPIDYINAHGTSTPVGDIKELQAVKETFGDNTPPIASTKSLSGHALGAAGVHEAIYSLIMLGGGFISASANITRLDPGAEGVPVVRERIDNVGLNTVMSNSFGFGGTNATLIFHGMPAKQALALPLAERQRFEFNKLKKRLRRLVGEAIADYRMIEAGDKVMVCLSGGKDSYTLLDILLSLRLNAPVDFDIVAVNLDQKQPGFPPDVLPRYLEQIGVPYHIIEQDTYSVVKRVVPEGQTTCGLCSRLRRGALYRYASDHGITKIALGHHRDDILETFFLNLFHGGSLKAMPPKLLSDNRRHIVIRPLAYCKERDIDAYARARDFPIIPCNLCGSQANLQRQAMKEMLHEWSKHFPGRQDAIFGALKNVAPSHLADTGVFDFANLESLRDTAGALEDDADGLDILAL